MKTTWQVLIVGAQGTGKSRLAADIREAIAHLVDRDYVGEIEIYTSETEHAIDHNCTCYEGNILVR